MDITVIVVLNDFEEQFTCLGENTEEYTKFSVPIRIDKKRKKITKSISYRLQFIDSARFMASSLSNLTNNLADRIHEIKYKFGHDNKKCETCGIKYKDCGCFFE